MRYQSLMSSWHLASAHHYASFPIPPLSCHRCDELQPVTSHYVTQNKQDKTHTNCHANMCLPTLFGAWKCNRQVPCWKTRGSRMALGCVRQTCLWHTVNIQILCSQPATAIMKAPPAVIISSSFQKKKKKSSRGFCSCWCHEARYKYVLINLAFVFRFGAIFMTGHILAAYV